MQLKTTSALSTITFLLLTPEKIMLMKLKLYNLTLQLHLMVDI